MDRACVTEARCDIIFIIALMKTEMDEGGEKKCAKRINSDSCILITVWFSLRALLISPAFVPRRRKKKKRGRKTVQAF